MSSNNLKKKLIDELDSKTQCLTDVSDRLFNIMILTKEMSIRNNDHIASAILDLMHKEIRSIHNKISSEILPF